MFENPGTTNVLRDDGISDGDYVEQLTYLLFLKMADERSRPPYHQPSPIPAAYACRASPARRRRAVRPLPPHAGSAGQEAGTLALIFGKAQNKFQDPAKLRRVATVRRQCQREVPRDHD
ncbi:MAG: hypothetical protein U5L03_09945 [Burkholderiaceae bacterium]|nr:hypothetical protein [Burkholderiaceae bacterium]